MVKEIKNINFISLPRINIAYLKKVKLTDKGERECVKMMRAICYSLRIIHFIFFRPLLNVHCILTATLHYCKLVCPAFKSRVASCICLLFRQEKLFHFSVANSGLKRMTTKLPDSHCFKQMFQIHTGAHVLLLFPRHFFLRR